MTDAAVGASRATTSDRILEGALRALGRHGFDKLGMSNVSRSAGVSRGTLYRYFPTKEDLLVALAKYEQARFNTGLETALAAAGGGEGRLNAMLDYVFRYLREHPALHRLLDDEPGFVLDYIRQQLPFLRRAMQRSIGSVLDQSAPVRAGSATPAQVVDVLLHVLVSNFVVPDRDPDALARAMKAIVGLPPERKRRSRRTPADSS